MNRAVIAAIVIIPAVILFAGCRKADVYYDYEGNVIAPPPHKAGSRLIGRHGKHGEAPAKAHPAEAVQGAGAHVPAATPTAQAGVTTP